MECSDIPIFYREGKMRSPFVYRIASFIPKKSGPSARVDQGG